MKKNTQKLKLFEFNGGFTGVMEKIFDLLLLGVLWILCCLPIITIGASTTALYYAVVKCVKKNNGYAFKEFFHSFKSNFIPATILWLIIGVTIFVVQLNMGILMKKTSGYAGLFFICFYFFVSLFMMAAACYAFPALSRFDMNPGWILKLSIYMAVRYFLTTLALGLIIVCVMALFWAIPLTILVTPGAAAFVASDFLERVLARHMPVCAVNLHGMEE